MTKSLRRGFAAGLLFALLAASGCDDGGRKPPSAAVAPALATDASTKTIGALAPADTAVLVRIQSRSELEKLTRAFSERFDGPAGVDALAMEARRFGVDPSNVDDGRPAAFAVALARGRPQARTLILPFDEPASAAASFEGPAEARDGYAAFTEAAEVGERGTALAASLPQGALSACLDMKRVTAAYRAQIDSFFSMFPIFLKEATKGSGADEEILNGMLGEARRFVDGAERLQVAVAHDDRGFEIDGWLRCAEGTLSREEGAELRPLLARMPDSLGITMLARADLAKLGAMFSALPAGVPFPEETRESLRRYQERMLVLNRMLGDEFALALGFEETGLEGVMALRAKDAAAYLSEYHALIREPVIAELGVHVDDEGERELSGRRIVRVRFRFDLPKLMSVSGRELDEETASEAAAGSQRLFDAILGPKGLMVEMTHVGDICLITLGGSGDRMRAAIASSEVPAALEPLLSRVPGDVDFACQIHVARLMRGMAKAMEAGLGLPADRDREFNQPFVRLVGGREGRTYRFGVTIR